MYSAGRCETGKVRSMNQDAIFIYNTQFGCLPNLYIVADGMGGHNAGEVASRLAVEFFCKYIHNENNMEMTDSGEYLDVMVAAASYSNQLVYEKSLSEDGLFGMGTTLTAVTIAGERVNVVHIGDSRLYHVRPKEGEIMQKTRDHSYVMELVRSGKLTKEQAEIHPKKNILTKVLGTEPTIVVDGLVFDMTTDDIILMSSDGLTNMVGDQEILDILSHLSNLEWAAQMLADRANEKGGVDNISVILAKNS